MTQHRFYHWAKLVLILLLVGVAVAYGPQVFAQLEVKDKELLEGSGIVVTKTFGQTVLTMVNYFIGFLGFLATLAFIYAGVLWVLNMGNDELITKAKKIMTYASLGIVVILLSFSAVRFITQSADEEIRRGSGAACTSDFDCNSGELCVVDEATGEQSCQSGECRISAQCPIGKVCFQNSCADPNEVLAAGVECVNAEQCDFANGQVCWDNICQRPPDRPGAPLECLASFHCSAGEYCAGGQCLASGGDVRCTSNEDCRAPRTCDASGFCRNPNAGSNSTCQNNTDCAANYVCNLSFNRCEFQGAGGVGGGGVTGGPSVPASERNLGAIQSLMDNVSSVLKDINDDLNALPQEDQDDIRSILLGQGSIQDKIGRLQDLQDRSDNAATVQVIERLISALTDLISVREELDELKDTMPQATETMDQWNTASEALDDLIDNPLSGIKLRQFETRYRELRDSIRRFPVVVARIRAVPAEGNVPFTVTFDGLDSVDPTGGTISDYRWTTLDNQGNEISLGNAPVIIHEFTEPNTYSVRLQVSTSQRDENGYKTASDGVSTVRIKANPPASQVNFRINGVEVTDVHRVTIKEAQAGLIFDPSPTVPALGRIITQYEWLFGDTATEIRTTPTSVVHSYPKAGEYLVKLVVTDSHGIKDQKTVKVMVNSLAADILINPKQGGVNTQYQFQGITSRSDGGAIVNYAWIIEDSKGQKLFESDEQAFFYKFDRPGEYRVNLLVTDVTGARDNAVKNLKVISRKPVAGLVFSTPESNHPNKIQFDAVSSYDPDEGDILKYSWDFDGDGSFEAVDSAESRATYSYKKTGNYRVRLQVQDNFSERDLTEDTVTIDSVLGADIFLPERAVQVGKEVTFLVKNSNAVSYLWEFGDGETASSEETEVKHIYRRKGRYNVKLHFFDDKDNEGADTTTVLVGNSDTPVAAISLLVNDRDSEPVEDLCGNGKYGYTVTRSDNVFFSAKESINTDGSARLLSYDWRFSDGSRNDKKEFTRRFNDLTSQCLEVSLVARDQVSGKGSEEEKIFLQVVNGLPTITDFVVEAPAGKTLVTPATVHLRVVNPKDSDGTIKRYKWWYYREGESDQKLGFHSTIVPETDLVITAVGQPGLKNRYHFVVEILDSDGGAWNSESRFSEVSTLDIENGPNLSPVAEFTLDKTAISAGDTISFVSQSYDPQGDPLLKSEYAWDFDGDGKFDDTTSGPTVSRKFNTPGEYQVRLKVTHRGLSSSVGKTVFVQPTQSLPQAAFNYSVNGTSVTFDGNNSRYDPDLEDKTLRYEWDFDVTSDADGNGVNDDDVQATEVRTTFNYGQVGAYRVRLQVKDSLGMTGVVVRDVDLSITDAERQRNTYRSPAIASPDQGITSLDVEVTPARLSRDGTADITVNVFNADNTPYSGKVFFEVIEGSGEFIPNAVDAKNGKAASIFSATDPGTVRLRVRATDTIYGDLTEEATLEVNP